jgi:hypothetical protein
MLEAAEILIPAELRYVESTHRPGIAATRALNLEGRLESDEIGSGTHVLCRHGRQLTRREHKWNSTACVTRAKSGHSDFERLR